MQVDDEELARKLQEEESASLRKTTRKPTKPAKQPVHTATLVANVNA